VNRPDGGQALYRLDVMTGTMTKLTSSWAIEPAIAW
jgi:hypothetical protein